MLNMKSEKILQSAKEFRDAAKACRAVWEDRSIPDHLAYMKVGEAVCNLISDLLEVEAEERE